LKTISYSILILIVSCTCLYSSWPDPIKEARKQQFDILVRTPNDTLKLNTFIDLSWDYRNSNIDSAFYFSDRGLELLDKFNHKKLEAKLLDIRSTLHQINDNLDSAEILQYKSLIIRTNINDLKGQRSSYEELGNIKRSRGYYKTALIYYLKALKVLDRIDFEDNENVNISEYKIKDHKTILNFLKDPSIENEIKYDIKVRDVKHPLISNLKRLIGETYLLKNDYLNSEKYLKEALDIDYKVLDIDQLLQDEISICRLYFKQNKFDTIITRINKCIEFGKVISNYQSVSQLYFLLSNSYLKLQKYDKSKVSLDSAKYYESKFKSKHKTNYSLLDLQLLLNTELSNNSIIGSAINKIETSNFTSEQALEFYLTLIQYYTKIDDKDSIIKYQQKYYTLKDSLIGLSTQKQLTELLELHENNKKIKTIANQEEQIVTYETLFLILIFLLLLIILILVYLTINIYKVKKLNKELNEVTNNKEKLFTFIAHDLRSPLQIANNVVKHLSDLAQPTDKSSYYIDELKNLLSKTSFYTENIMLWSRTKTGKVEAMFEEVQIHELVINSINTFVYIAKEKEIEIALDLSQVISETDKNLLQIIINNIVQNAIIHSENKTTLNITLQSNSKVWDFVVINTPSKVLNQNVSNGIGLTIIQEYTTLLKLYFFSSIEKEKVTVKLSNQI
jgi:signal transduction histidine kinase